jgi:hypothetical protein
VANAISETVKIAYKSTNDSSIGRTHCTTHTNAKYFETINTNFSAVKTAYKSTIQATYWQSDESALAKAYESQLSTDEFPKLAAY